MKRAEIIDIIKASDGGDIRVDSKAGYKENYTVDDIGDNQFLSKSMFFDTGGGGSLPLTLYAAGSAIPYFVDISLYPTFSEYSTVMTFSPVNGQMKRFYDMDVINQDTNDDGTGTFTGWNVYGHTNDGSVTSEDLLIVLKP